MRYGFLLVFFFGLGEIVFAQLPSQSSREEVQKSLKNDLDSLRKRSKINQFDAKGYQTAQKLLATAQSYKFLRLEEDLLIYAARQQRYASHLQSSSQLYQAAIKHIQQRGDTPALVKIQTEIGEMYFLENRLSTALDYFYQAHKTAETIPQKPVNIRYFPYIRMGEVYAKIGDLKMAKDNFMEALQIKQQAQDTTAIGVVYMGLADIERQQGHYTKAIEFYQMVLKKRINSKNLGGIGLCFLDLGTTYGAIPQFDSASFYLERALRLFTQTKNVKRQSEALLKLGDLNQKAGKTQRALGYLKRAQLLSQKTQSPNLLMNAHLQLSQLSAQQNDYKSAYQHLNEYVSNRDSLLNADSQRQLNVLRAKYEVERKERDIRELEAQHQQNLRERSYWISGVLFLLFVSALTIYLNRLRRHNYHKLKEQKLQTDALLVEKEELVKQLQNAQVQLVQSEKMASIGLLTAGIAHEINNPVNFVANNVQALKLDLGDLDALLQKLAQLQKGATEITLVELQQLAQKADVDFLNNEIGALIQSIERGTERTHEIVNGLRIFARADGDNFMPFNVETGLDTTLTLLTSTYKEHLIVEKDYANVPEIMGLPSKLNQVFMNVIHNAIQAIKKIHPTAQMPTGRLKITTQTTEKSLFISIQDNGSGMDTSTQSRIFEPFFTTKPIGEGTGLGLSISYGIIEQHRGKISVSSQVNRGSTFTIELPRYPLTPFSSPFISDVL
jgi:two-component system, NtrC family, sensor kinase